MTTVEEALTEGWHTPVPTFFGPLNEDSGVTDAFEYFRQCPNSTWAVTELSDPKPVLDDGHPNVRAFQAEVERRGASAVSEALTASLPHFTPIARPVRYQRLGAEARYR